MRHVAVGRHARYPYRPTRWSYVIVFLAALAALVASLALASQSESAQAQPAARQAPVVMTDRGAEVAVADDSAVQLVRAKTVAARLAAVRVRAAAAAAALTYTVRAGDTISSVAVRRCGAARDWTGIYAASRLRHLTARNANVLTAGQHLWLSCSYDPHQLGFAPKPPPPPPVRVAVVRHAYYHGSVRHVYYHRAYHRSYSGGGSVSPAGSYEACVISRESGGRSQVMNSSGHYGLYQFDYGTWVSGGGSGADFGHASAAEQQRVFRAVYAARGTQPWSPSDGC